MGETFAPSIDNRICYVGSDWYVVSDWDIHTGSGTGANVAGLAEMRAAWCRRDADPHSAVIECTYRLTHRNPCWTRAATLSGEGRVQ